ncbi:MAG: UvrD-helicase domain-containing protein, partial [Elusimicrobia bacterium]|nr:UvrD-helicase domain-containing protein [Elusimicrobiota bacterium]
MIQELSTALAEERQNALETGENPVGRLRDLNPSQMKAVLHDQGPLLIVAGAGTGKTTVLTRRIAHLITSKRAFPREILALTFTDKAAREMEDRVDRLVPYGFNDVWISTFHSFGDRILREYAFEIGMSPNARVLSLPEAVVLLSQRLFEFKLDYYRPLSDPTRFMESLLTAFSRAKDEDVSPEEFLQSAQNSLKNAKSQEEKESAKKMLEVARAYQTYENLKTQKGLIDFGDQVVLALKILRERANVLKKIQAQFKYILVDEFQDTNYAQFEILKLLTSKSQNITVVGDDDQSIYKFRGACLSNILQFRGQYPLCQEIVLQENYRSTQEVLDTAYKLIQHNNPDRLEYRDQISKFLRSHKTGGQRVSHRHFETLFSETEFVVSQIQKRVQSGQNQPGDFAILVRTNAGAEPFLKSLNSAGIPWRFSGSGGLYEQEEIRVALAFLRCVDQPNDSASLYYLATSSLYGLDGETCARTTQLADKSRRSLEEVFRACLKDEANDLRLEPESQKKIESLVRDLKKFRQRAATTPTGFLLYQFFEESGVL